VLTGKRSILSLGALLAVAVTLTSCLVVTDPILIDRADGPDPSGVLRPDGSIVVFTTQANGYRIQRLTFGPRLRRTSRSEALVSLGPWMSGADLWAPDVAPSAAGGWVMYFGAAASADSPYGAHRCIGRARSADLLSGFVADGPPVVCSDRLQEEFIDPSVFIDDDGSRWLLYRRGSTDGTREIFSVAIDPATDLPTGEPHLLVNLADASPAALTRRASHVENPQLVRVYPNRTFELLVSAGDWGNSTYLTLAFNCDSPMSCNRRAPGSRAGPYHIALRSEGSLKGPGGVSLLKDERSGRAEWAGRALFHAIVPGSNPLRRAVYLGWVREVP
jgi:hypothetical protein